MLKSFVETSRFTQRVQELLTDEEYFSLQNELMARPDAGAVMPGCGGLRKLRVADPHRQKGKRGGLRVIYLHIPEADLIYFLRVYSKEESEDLNAEQKKHLRRLADAFRSEALKFLKKTKRGGR